MLKVSADLLCDSHDSIGAEVLLQKSTESQWSNAPMHLVDNDRWESSFHLARRVSIITVRAWVDHFSPGSIIW